MLLPITSIFAAIFTFILMRFSLNVVNIRRKHQIRVLDGGNEELTNAIRGQGNFVEYTPFTLLLMALSEAQGMPWQAVLALGSIFLASRLAHYHSLTKREAEQGSFTFRIRSMQATFFVMVSFAGYLVYVYIDYFVRS